MKKSGAAEAQSKGHGLQASPETAQIRARWMMRNAVLFMALGLGLGALFSQDNAGSFPDAVTADPTHYSVSFENDVVRILRVSYDPGEKSVMHRHPASCAVFLTDQTFNFTIPDGSTLPDSVEAGQLGCGDANVHLPENIGPDTAAFVMIEFKNRERFRD